MYIDLTVLPIKVLFLKHLFVKKEAFDSDLP